MAKLKKEDFNRAFRFREARTSSVSCATCKDMSGEMGYDKKTFCEHNYRFRRITLTDYLGPGYGSWNTASTRLCDAHAPKPLPDGITIDSLAENHALILRDIIHTGVECSYVIEEARARARDGKKPLEAIDISKWKYSAPYSICEMPCCESNLALKPCMPDYYRQKNGLKPDGTD